MIGAFYYLKIIKTMYFDAPSGELAQGRNPVDFSIITACAAVIVLGYLLNPLLGSASAAAAALAVLRDAEPVLLRRQEPRAVAHGHCALGSCLRRGTG